MNKQELITTMSEKTNMSKKDTKNMINAFVETIEEALAKGKKVSLIGFGTWEVRERSARKGRNPQTGEVIDIPASKTPAFKAGKELKDKVK